uniref:Maf-like protein DDB_G0281937 n=1 Tax=Nelumbo nucifera TaxID=4432 RepID=A0A822XJE1_NELNU|nr:TPA_asm: hypothetical protein HUJ06_023107 [Nelumbo nucifera]
MATDTASFKIILGSKSMTRQNILTEMGYKFTIMTADIDEKAIRKEHPEDLVMALAEAKADAIISTLQNTDCKDKDAVPTLLITADQLLKVKSEKSHPTRKKHANSSEAILVGML